jgi:hypothetical protein
MVNGDFIRLEGVGSCGVGEAKKSLDGRYREFELKVFLWRSIPEFENQSSEIMVVRPTF